MSAGVPPDHTVAADPTDTTLLVVLSIATTEGSESTTPYPLTNTSVLAVPSHMTTSGAGGTEGTHIFLI